MAVISNIETLLGKFWAVLTISMWIGIGLYFGTGGYNDIKIRQDRKTVDTEQKKIISKTDSISINTLKVTSKEVELNEIANNSIYPFIEILPNPLITLITVFSFGILGSIIDLLKQIVLDNKEIETLKFISQPLLGMFTGFIIIGLSLLVPNTLATNDIELKPLSIVFLSLFSGFFSTKFYTFLSSIFDKLFK